MKFASLADLPEVATCKLCGKTKPVAEMMLVRRRSTGDLLLRPRCKECHNQRERGRRRKWKRAYLRKWRARNPGLDRSYWKALGNEVLAARAARWRERNRLAIAIKRRLQKGLGVEVAIDEARELLRRFGMCYPTPQGLTPAGRKEFERLRSKQRRIAKPLSAIELRIILYEEGYFVKPAKQREPYRARALRLQAWHASQGHRVRARIAPARAA